jgi:hypothetical protein
MMNLKKLLETLTKEKAPGPMPSFQVFHVIKALELIAQPPVGRGTLAKKLAIGDGATRTLIERLKDEEIIFTTKSGCFLTKKGEDLWKQVKRVFPSKIELEKSKLTLSACNVAMLVKGKRDRVKLGVEQRDAAFLAGARGATTLVIKKGKLVMPSVDVDVSEDFPDIYEKIVNSFKLTEGDVVVIGSADSCNKAEYGAIAAAWTLLNNDN